MTEEAHGERESLESLSEHGHSVLRFLEAKTGEAPRVNLGITA